MASIDVNSLEACCTGETLNGSFSINMEEAYPGDFLRELDVPSSSFHRKNYIPTPPPFPCKSIKRVNYYHKRLNGHGVVPKETQLAWDRLFKEGPEADVHIVTEDESIIPAHSIVLSLTSTVVGNLLQQSKVRNGRRYINIQGVPSEAVYTFTRFLYSSCYDEEEMKKYALHLLVLSHSYSVPSLKRACIYHLEQGWLNTGNVIDVLLLARKCDASRLSFICTRMAVKNFKIVSSTEGWKVMRRANPVLEQELLEHVVEADSSKEERLRKKEEKKVYLRLNEAIEALVHICRDGCRTIGPCDKMLKGSHAACEFPACKGVESLVRHFSICKIRVPGGCAHCKRVWQLLELHSRTCDETGFCKVPLCRHFKERVEMMHNRKEAMKWKLLVSKVIAAKTALGPFSTRYRTCQD